MIQTLNLEFHQGPTYLVMHIIKLLQTQLIETEGNMGVMIYISQGGLLSSSLHHIFC